MGLNAALVDRARVVERRAAGARVEGRTLYGETRGAWFRCRLTLPSTREVQAAATRMPQANIEPTLLVGDRDEAGDPVTLTIAQRVEVDSPELGEALWEVVTEPEPLRKKRRVLGYQATVRRIETRPADEAA